ncbi:MAG: hypothetical protein MAG715_00556 [Methanonatronarchaeales archaeon]|nr:hypothetical protein [Methanonatronarchaeales archaeon]
MTEGAGGDEKIVSTVRKSRITFRRYVKTVPRKKRGSR